MATTSAISTFGAIVTKYDPPPRISQPELNCRLILVTTTQVSAVLISVVMSSQSPFILRFICFPPAAFVKLMLVFRLLTTPAPAEFS